MELDFQRNPALLSTTTLEKSAAAKYRLSNFYKTLVEECADREQRRKEALAAVTKENWSEESIFW